MTDRQQFSELKTDVRLLLECLKYQVDNPNAVKQALLTISSIFSNCDPGIKDFFQEIGGIQFLFNLITSVTNSEVKETALFSLGCCIEKNVYSQKLLSTSSTFTYLHKLLSDQQCTTRLKQTAAFFLLCLVSNNSHGQVLAKSSLCLSDLLELLRSSLPKNLTNDISKNESWFDDAGLTSLELWSSVASALCMCVNNPQNEQNQSICGFMLPQMFSFLEQHKHPLVVRPLMSLIGFVVACNSHNQDQVRRCGGLRVLVKSLKHTVCKSSEPQTVSLAVQIISTIDSCIADNVENSEEIGRNGAIKVMLSLLDMDDVLDDTAKLQIIVTLGHAVELSGNKASSIDTTLHYSWDYAQTVHYPHHALQTSPIYFKTPRKCNVFGMCCEASGKQTFYLIDESENQGKGPNSVVSMVHHYFKTYGYGETNACVHFDNCGGQNKNNVVLWYALWRVIAELNRNQICEDVGLPKLIHHLTDTEDEEFSKAVKYLLQICVNSKEKNNKIEIENSQNKNRNEGMQMKSGLVLLQKISEITDKLKAIEHEASHNNRTLLQTLCHTPEQNLLLYYQQPIASNDVTLTPRERGLLYQLQKERKERERLENNSGQNFIRRICNNVVNHFSKQNSPTCYDSVNRNSGAYLYDETYQCSNQVTRNSDFGAELKKILKMDFVENTDCMDDNNGFIQQPLTGLGAETSKGELDLQRQYKVLDRSVKQTQEADICDFGNRNLCESNYQRFQQDFRGKNNCKNSEEENGQNEETEKSRKIAKFSEKTDMMSSIDMDNLTRGNKGHDLIHNKQLPLEHMDNNAKNDGLVIVNNNAVVSSTSDKACEQEKACNVASQCDIFSVMKSGNNNKYMDSPCKNVNNNNQNTSVGRNIVTCNKLEVLNNNPNRFQCRLSNGSSSQTENVNSGKNQTKENNELDSGNNVFVKPTGVPLRKKTNSNLRRGIRMAKPLGKLSDLDKISDTVCCSDVQSEFDCQLLKDASKRHTDCVAESSVDKDFLMNKFKNSASGICGTPKSHCVPIIKPAYSDCGQRRHSSILIRNPQINPSFSAKPLPKPDWFSVKPYTDNNTFSSNIKSELDSPGTTVGIKRQKENCPGCTASIFNSDTDDQRINSRTYNLIIETSTSTCHNHRHKREIERKYIKAVRQKTGLNSVKRLKQQKSVNALLHHKKEKKSKCEKNVYDFLSSDSDIQKGNVTPPHSSVSSVSKVKILQMNSLYDKQHKRRPRIPYTEEEINNILAGVKTLGTRWNQILCTYAFHSSRTAVDLADKYKRLMNKNQKDDDSVQTSYIRHKPFSMCEDRRLARGVKRYGYSWKTILHSFNFADDRTSEDLRNRWRTLHKHSRVCKVLNK